MYWLKIICDENNITIMQLAEKMKRPQRTLYDWNVRDFERLMLSDMGQLAEALGMTPKEFVEKYYERFIER